jgi:mannose-6-phosphate isomerase
MSSLDDALREPIALAPNRVPRFYRGGSLLDGFRGSSAPADDDRPEDWVGSATRAWTPPGHGPTELGLSSVTVDGRTTTLDVLLREAPDAMAGPQLVERAGPTLGVLVKLLDAGERLPVHAHPSRADAARHLGSPFGKTEAWIILGTHGDGPGRVWAGFREPVPPDRLREWIDGQDGGAMLEALVEHRVAAGDVLLIRAGIPHAIGAGVFLLELQEPTDFSIVLETRGFPVDEADASLHLGWDRALEMVRTTVPSEPGQVPAAVGPGVERLLGPDADPFFRALRQRIGGAATPPFEPQYAIGIVLGGRGEVRGHSTALDLEPGTTFALPAASVPHARVAGDDLELAWCLGPEPAALDRSSFRRAV